MSLIYLVSITLIDDLILVGVQLKKVTITPSARPLLASEGAFAHKQTCTDTFA